MYLTVNLTKDEKKNYVTVYGGEYIWIAIYKNVNTIRLYIDTCDLLVQYIGILLTKLQDGVKWI